VYFLPPAGRQWYIDNLFRQGSEAGEWMGLPEQQAALQATWALSTYRIGKLPRSLREAIRREFVPVGSALGMNINQGKRIFAVKDRGIPPVKVSSYWYLKPRD